MPAIADTCTDKEMQDSAPAFLDAVVQASKERLAKKKLAAQAKATKLQTRAMLNGAMLWRCCGDVECHYDVVTVLYLTMFNVTTL
jgi:hypothetical protein